jgi:hypothetical protein
LLRSAASFSISRAELDETDEAAGETDIGSAREIEIDVTWSDFEAALAEVGPAASGRRSVVAAAAAAAAKAVKTTVQAVLRRWRARARSEEVDDDERRRRQRRLEEILSESTTQ